ncbi:MAG: TraB/GumN family protein, partial [Muribaculaceae bacterium]|nr:TraB/GumN family protein [Muribaculaceae bacterium]
GKTLGKTVVPLETVEYQASVLYDTTPIALQAEALVEMLKDPEKAIKAAKDISDAYEAQDLDKMIALSEKDDEHPEFMIALLDKRNNEWLEKLPEIMKEAPSFIAVGALHLAGEKGIIEGLKKYGYTVTPVK